jgi:signal transduction histidine kinase
LVVLLLIQLPLARSLARRVERANRDREALLQRAIDASDLERRRIAADLHDGTVQELIAASYAVASAREGLAGDDKERAEALRRAEQTCRRAVRQLRSLLVDIYPPRLREAGLPSALRDLLSAAERNGVETSLDAPSELRLPDGATALLYRAAQEAVRNAAAHGHASRIDVAVSQRNGHAALVVADDGVGFSVEEALARPERGHFGLRLLSDQARDAGGTLQIDSSPGRGTRVRLEVPTE